MKKILIASILAISITACSIDRFTVGNGPYWKDPSKVEVSRGMQFFLFGGLIPLNHPNLNHPQTDYQFVAKTNLLDAIISGVTFGLITSRTEVIYVNNPTKK